MNSINIYLTFDGNCEEAFTFYKSVFDLPFESFSRFKDMPPSDDGMSFPEEEAAKVMHVSIRISDETLLMGSDAPSNYGPPWIQGNNFSVSIDAGSKDEADLLFGKLSKGGMVTMPMENTFWGSYFGMVTDPFGINWMVSFATEPPS